MLKKSLLYKQFFPLSPNPLKRKYYFSFLFIFSRGQTAHLIAVLKQSEMVSSRSDFHKQLEHISNVRRKGAKGYINRTVRQLKWKCAFSVRFPLAQKCHINFYLKSNNNKESLLHIHWG